MERYMMKQYTTIDGKTYELRSLPLSHRRFLRQVVEWYQAGIPFPEFTQRILGGRSPVFKGVRPGEDPTTRPVYDIATDLQARFGVKQGLLVKDWEGEVDPLWQ